MIEHKVPSVVWRRTESPGIIAFIYRVDDHPLFVGNNSSTYPYMVSEIFHIMAR